MRIDQIHIENFKKFALQDVDLHPKFTLLVGENWAGKTTLLDALAVMYTNAQRTHSAPKAQPLLSPGHSTATPWVG